MILTQVSCSATVAALICGDIADRVGRQLTLFGALSISFIAVALEYVATSSPLFFAGKLLNGVMVGTIGTIMVSYIGEVCNSTKILCTVPDMFANASTDADQSTRYERCFYLRRGRFLWHRPPGSLHRYQIYRRRR